MKRHEIEKDEGLRGNLSEARFFKDGRREPPATRVWTDGIIESLNVSEHSAGSLVVGMEMQQMEALAFEAAKEVFGDSVVVGIALTAHTLDEPSAHEGGAKACGGVLDAAIGVEDQAGVRPLSVDGHEQGFENQIGINPGMPVVACTVAMSSPKEIEYTLHFDSSTIQ